MSTSTLYLILCGQYIDEYAPERDVKDMNRATTVREIAEGQFKSLTRVLEVATGADVTADLARDVMTRWAHDGEPLSDWQRDFVELHVGLQAANSFRRAA